MDRTGFIHMPHPDRVRRHSGSASLGADGGSALPRTPTYRVRIACNDGRWTDNSGLLTATIPDAATNADAEALRHDALPDADALLNVPVVSEYPGSGEGVRVSRADSHGLCDCDAPRVSDDGLYRRGEPLHLADEHGSADEER